MKILIGALFLSLWQSLLFWKQDLGISVLLFTIPIIWITTKLLKGNIKNKKALLISIPIIVLSSTYFIFDGAENRPAGSGDHRDRHGQSAAAARL